VLLAVGLGVFSVMQTSAAISAFKSRTAITLMLAAAVGWVVLRLVLLWCAPWPALRLLVFSVAALLVLKVVVLPAYDDTTVVEALPVDAAATSARPTEPTPPPATTGSTTTGSTTTGSTATGSTTTGSTAATSTAATSTAATSPVSPPAGPSPVGAGVDGTADSPEPPATVSPPVSPAATASADTPRPIAAAPLHGIDHRATGTARIYEQPSGQLVIGLEDIDIQPGPDYDLYVVAGRDADDVDGGLRLDDLRGNKGTQYYPVPDGSGLVAGEWTVLVWCQVFDVPVAGATPT
jgi:hypothetical protein